MSTPLANDLHCRPRPFVVDLCVKEIEGRGLDAEGLYRVSPSNDDLDSLRLTFDEGKRLLLMLKIMILR